MGSAESTAGVEWSDNTGWLAGIRAGWPDNGGGIKGSGGLTAAALFGALDSFRESAGGVQVWGKGD